MKKLVVLLLLALIEVSTAQPQKNFCLAVSVGRGDKEPPLFEGVVDSLANALIEIGAVSELKKLAQPKFHDFALAVEEISNSASRSDLLYILFLLHGSAYSWELKTPLYGVRVTEKRWSDGREDSLKIRANVFPHDSYSLQDVSLGMNEQLVQIVDLEKVGEDSIEVKGRKFHFEFKYYNAHAVELITQCQNLDVGGKCAITARFYYLDGDSDHDGVISNRHAYVYKYKTGMSAPFFTDELLAVSDSVFCNKPWGANQQVDNDPDKLPDQIFCVMTEDGPRLACDLNNPDSVWVEGYQTDLIDIDNDGFFDHGDINQDGDMVDFIEFPSAVRFADRVVDFREVIPILSTFPGKVIFLNGACYGGKHISLLPPGMIGYSFCGKHFTARYDDLSAVARNIVKDKPSTLLDLFNRQRGWLNDNGDAVVTARPWTGAEGEDGYISSQIGLIPPKTPVIFPAKPLPEVFTVHQNYPNPFNSTTTIKYSLPQAETVQLTIYNILGQKVKDLVNVKQPAGSYNIVWDATDRNGMTVPTGVYFYRIEASDFVRTKTMTLMK
ncbi:T9SS type A sorting domain-containing protein [Candidatus Kuenenbacteria bacterium]|nr:T9SS type A sorting domain-containing protein [Candidatus Kuenenbacteria bacterium]